MTTLLSSSAALHTVSSMILSCEDEGRSAVVGARRTEEERGKRTKDKISTEVAGGREDERRPKITSKSFFSMILRC